jgi:DNA (cytosine-5)-methyltransferase 1
MLENVRNLVSHDDGNTWKVITNTLKDIGYRLTQDPLIISPTEIGTPQLRPRVIIAGKYDPLHKDTPLVINIPKNKVTDIYDIIEDKVDPSFNISKKEENILTIWDEFYKGISQKTLGFPVWVDSFKDSTDISSLPLWKQGFINKNKQLYKENKQFIELWLAKWNNLNDLTPSNKNLNGKHQHL